MLYKLKRHPEANKERQIELRLSIKTWGRDHARKYFSSINTLINNLRARPHLFPKSPNKKYRMIRTKGHYIPYVVDDEKKEVTILAFIGKNRMHEIGRIASKRVK